MGIALGLSILSILVVGDVLLEGEAPLVLGYTLAIFAAAGFAVFSTTVVGAFAFAAAAASPVWNGHASPPNYWLRLAGVAFAWAFAVYIARRWERLANLSGRLALLDEISAVADGSLSLDSTLSHALDQIVPEAADFCMIDTIREGAVTRVGARAGGHPDRGEVERWLRTREPSTPRWLRNPEFGIPLQPMFMPRVRPGHEEILSHGSDDLRYLRALGLRSVAVVPMTARGRLLGALTLVVAWSGRSYSSDDLAFARVLASRLALALDHAGLFSDLESVERRMDAVLERIPESVSVRDGRGKLVYANDVCAEWLGLASGAEAVGSDTQWLDSRLGLFDEQGAALTRAELIDQLEGAGHPIRSRLVRLAENHSGRERWGALSMDAIRSDGSILYVVTTIEDITAAKRAELGERVLSRAAVMLADSSDYRTALGRVAEAATPALADGCAILLTDRAGAVDTAGFAGGSEEELRPSEADIAEVIAQSGPRMIRVGMGEAVAAAIGSGSVNLGVLLLANIEGGRPFGEADLDIAADLGSRLSSVIEVARMTGMRREIASTLQQALQPDALPRIDGWDLASMYRPAGELNDVGGDFYDAVRVENGWMVMMGDVVGRGARAAALTSVARNTLRTALTITGDPREALRVLNTHLCSRSDQPLCSVVIVVLSDEPDDSADAVIACAGHPLPLIIRGEEVSEACRPGALLGALPEAGWGLELVTLGPGEQLVIYTDGIIEARMEGGLLGEKGLADRLRGAAGPEDVVERIEKALTGQADELADDAAAIALMRLPGRGGEDEGAAPARLAAARRG